MIISLVERLVVLIPEYFVQWFLSRLLPPHSVIFSYGAGTHLQSLHV